MNRKDGYYWVKEYSRWYIGRWTVDADCGTWYVAGNENMFEDNDFEEIDERQIIRID